MARREGRPSQDIGGDGPGAGFSLLELLIVLGALGVLLTVVTAAVGVLETGRIETIVQDVGTLRQAAARWIERGRLDYTRITVGALTAEGELPTSWRASTPYGGAYTVAPAASDATHLTVTVSGLSASVGQTLVTYYTGRVQSVRFAVGTLTITF